MDKIVNLKEHPYNLTSQDVEWVQQTISSMSLQEKISQLLVYHVTNYNEFHLQKVLQKYPVGGITYQPEGAKEVLEMVVKAQQASPKLPLLVANKSAFGGEAVAKEGVYLANGAQCLISDDISTSYIAGVINSKLATAVGSNWNIGLNANIFFPDVSKLSKRHTYGYNTFDTKQFVRAYVAGIHRCHDRGAVAINSFPGVVIKADNNNHFGYNNLSYKEWDASYRDVFRALIMDGVETIVVGHILAPSLMKKFNYTLTDKDLVPATLSHEIVNDLLKNRLGFNGVAVADDSTLLSLWPNGSRKDYLPKMLAAGIDMILNPHDLEEDVQYLVDGYHSGVFSETRLNDALTRVLGLKVKFKLHDKTALHHPDPAALTIFQDFYFLGTAQGIANKAITLYHDPNKILPLSKEQSHKIALYLDVAKEGLYSESLVQELTNLLTAANHQVDVRDLSKIDYKTIGSYQKEYDLSIVISDGDETSIINKVPFYVLENKSVLVNLNADNCLCLLKKFSAIVNAYEPVPVNIKLAVEKIAGKTIFFKNTAFCMC